MSVYVCCACVCECCVCCARTPARVCMCVWSRIGALVFVSRFLNILATDKMSLKDR